MTNSSINLKPNEHLSSCDDQDVISFDSKDPIYISKLFALVASAFEGHIIHYISNSITQKLTNKCDAKLWFEDGEKCEILKATSSGWKTGKMKLKINISLEFIPDQPEQDKSPLDDVRQEFNQNN